MKYKKRQEWFLDNEQELATIPSRIFAMLIDMLLILIIFYITSVRLLLKQNQLVRIFMSKLVQIGSVKQLI